MKRKKRISKKPVLSKVQKAKVFTTFSRLVLGAIKIWLHGSPYIILANEVNDFIEHFPNVQTKSVEVE